MIFSKAPPATGRARRSRVRRRVLAAVAVACAALVPGGCGENGSFFVEPDTEPLEATIGTAVPLGYAASAAMAVLQGHRPPLVEVLVPCQGSRCLFLLAVTVEPGSLPAELGYDGVILVAGLGLSPDTAILSVFFLDWRAGTSRFPVSHVGTVPAVLDGDQVTVVYANIDIDVELPSDPLTSVMLDDLEIARELERLDTPVPSDVELALQMDALVVGVDTAGTPLDLADDSFTISGASQMVAVANAPPAGVFQLGVVGLWMTPSCPRNPLAGLAAIQNLGVRPSSPLLVAQAVITFRSACSGKAHVLVGTGNYLTSTGRSVPLHLGRR